MKVRRKKFIGVERFICETFGGCMVHNSCRIEDRRHIFTIGQLPELDTKSIFQLVENQFHSKNLCDIEWELRSRSHCTSASAATSGSFRFSSRSFEQKTHLRDHKCERIMNLSGVIWCVASTAHTHTHATYSWQTILCTADNNNRKRLSTVVCCFFTSFLSFFFLNKSCVHCAISARCRLDTLFFHSVHHNNIINESK